MKKILEVVFGIYFFIVAYLCSFLMHVFTAYIVYDSYGWFLGILSFFSPIISTIIMVILYTIFYGLFNGFNIIVIIYLLLYVPIIILGWLINKLEEKEKSKIQKNIENVEYETEFFEELKRKNAEYDNEKSNTIQPLYCSQCGTKLEKNDSFCCNCGNKVKE